MEQKTEPQKVFIPVEVGKELPLENGWYNTIDTVGNENNYQFLNGYFVNTRIAAITHWLKEQELYCFTKEELEKMRQSDYVNGQNNGSEAMVDINKYIHFSQYIQSLNLK